MALFTSWRDHANQFSSWGTSGTASPSQSWISWSLNGKTNNCIMGDPTLQMINHLTSAAPGLSFHKVQSQPPGNLLKTCFSKQRLMLQFWHQPPNPHMFCFTSRMRSLTNLLCLVSWPWRSDRYKFVQCWNTQPTFFLLGLATKVFGVVLWPFSRPTQIS